MDLALARWRERIVHDPCAPASDLVAAVQASRKLRSGDAPAWLHMRENSDYWQDANDPLVVYVLDPAVNYRGVAKLVTVYWFAAPPRAPNTTVGKAAKRKARERRAS